jgi:hypothetical protein
MAKHLALIENNAQGPSISAAFDRNGEVQASLRLSHPSPNRGYRFPIYTNRLSDLPIGHFWGQQ